MITHPVIVIIAMVLLLVLSAFFSGSETALMSLSRLRVRSLKSRYPLRTGSIERILEAPEKVIGTILLGNNLVNVAMSALATVLAVQVWGERGILYVTVGLTFIILIFAEVTPKVYAKYFNERVSLFAAPLLYVMMKLLAPVTTVATVISSRVLALVGVNISKVKRPLFTEAEVQTCIRMAGDDGTISAAERRMLARVFTLNDKTVGDIMVPREKAVFIHVGDTPSSVAALAAETGFSRFPVLDCDEKRVLGFVHSKDLLVPRAQRLKKIDRLMRPPYLVSGKRTIDVQLRHFQARKQHQAVVTGDEGMIVGLVTLEDVLEELVGTIMDEYDGG